MREGLSDKLRLLVIASTVVSAAMILVLGIPRARDWMTPRLERVWVVSAALGDRTATASAREVQAGTPVTLYAVIEARPRGADGPALYGTIDSVLLPGDDRPREVLRWSDWWLAAEFLWFKVEPAYPFANDEFDPAFRVEQIQFIDNYQVNWGFGWSHAADIDPGGDAYPDWPGGTMRFAAHAVVRDHRDRILQRTGSPGAQAVYAASEAERPYRLTVVSGDDAFGRLTGFAGLPYVPFTADTESEARPASLYVGGTVLDFWLLANRQAGAWKGRLVQWDQLQSVAERVVADMFLANDGAYYYTADPLRQVTWDQVREGDILAIEDHVGILYEDRGPGGGGDGVLNRWDRVIEAYFEPLRQSDLGDAFVADVSVYRLRADPGGS